MKRFTVLIILLSLFTLMLPTDNPVLAQETNSTPIASDEKEQAIQVGRVGSQPSMEGPADNFTGTVRVEMLLFATEPTPKAAANVMFEAGARTAWHSHPLGQLLVVTEGAGWVQQEGEEAQEILAGDTVWISPNIEHWHGASATSGMTHIAVQEALDGQSTVWMELVSDEDYDAVHVEALEAEATTSASSQGLQSEDLAMVSPALQQTMQEVLEDDLWQRPELSPRDRSIITVAALIARNQTIDMPYHFALALDNGVTPSELSEIINHLAFYSGWSNAMSAVAVAQELFTDRGIDTEQLPLAAPELLPLDQEAEDMRAGMVEQSVGPVSPGLVQYTADALFLDLWLRPDLAPRDRSLATVSALIASGNVDQIGYHLSRAMGHGLTQTEAGEVLTHLAFYAGWPNAFSAVPIVQGVFERRSE